MTVELSTLGSVIKTAYDGQPKDVDGKTDNYVLVLGDAQHWIRVNKATSNTVTVPNHADVNFVLGTEITIEQSGAGQTTVVADSGVTVRTAETLALAKQYAVATLKKVAADEWNLVGYLELAP